MRFCKYEFSQDEWDRAKPTIQTFREERDDVVAVFDRDLVISVVEIGFIIGENERPSDKYSVDIIWVDDELPNFITNKIYPLPIGIHSFGDSIDVLYEEEYNNNI